MMERVDDQDYNKLYKSKSVVMIVIVVGDANVGKTHMVQK